MALSPYREGDRMMGQSVGSGTGSAFIPAFLSVDATGTALVATVTTVYRLLSSAATVNATNAAAAACTLRNIVGYAVRSTVCYLKIYDKATAPTQADTPILTIPLVPSAGFALDFNIKLVNGLGYRLTTGSADADTAAVASGDVVGLNLVTAA